MALVITSISTTLNSATFIAKSLHEVEHGFWGYSLNGGSYVVFDSSSRIQVIHTITGLSEGTTYSLRVRAYVTGIGTLVYTDTVNFTTKKSQTAPTVTASVSAISTDRFTITGSANYPCKIWQYSIDDGSNWSSLSDTTSASSVNKVITGLAEDTLYKVKVRATRTYNDVRGTSSTVNATTTKNQTPPIVTCTLSAATTVGFTITGSANYPCKTWQYSIDGGSWQSLSASASASSVSKVITGLSENKEYSVQVRATRTYNDVRGTSSAKTITTTKSQTPPTVTASVSDITSKSFKVSGSANYECKTWQYSLDDGKTWSTLSSATGTKASRTVTGLLAGATYKVKVRATRIYNDVRGTSSSISASTPGASLLSAVNTIFADFSPAKMTFNIIIPSDEGFDHRFYIYDGETLVTNIPTSSLAHITESGWYTIDIPANKQEDLLNHIPTKKSFTARVEMQTLDNGVPVGNWSPKNVIITTTESNSAPIMSGFQHSEENGKVSAVTTAGYVRHLSDIKVVCNLATARNGASISKYGAKIGSKTVESGSRTIAFGAPTTYGSNSVITAYVEDSRGYRRTLTDTSMIYQYDWPAVLEWQYRRKDSIGEQTALVVTGTIRIIGTNALKTAQYRIRPSGGTWGSWTTLSGMTNIGTVTPGRRGYKYDNDNWQTLDAEKSHTVQLRYRDEFDEYSSVVQFTVSRGIPIMSFRDGAVGVNKFAPEATLHVGGDIIADDDVTANGVTLPMGLFTTNMYGSISDCNQVEKPVAYAGTGASNRPSGEGGMIVLTFTYTQSGGGVIAKQVGFGINGNTMWVRHKSSAAWGAWAKVL